MNAFDLIEQMKNGNVLSRSELAFLLSLPPGPEQEMLFQSAYQVKLKNVGNKVHLRGLVEFSNLCTKDCYYCGIRKSNHAVKRYQLTEDEIVREALLSDRYHLGSVVLQSGERREPAFCELVERVVRRIKQESNDRLGITLSTGEQSEETYRRWFEAGAHRFLLRIEASDPELYAKLHPANHSWQDRKHCLDLLTKVGYQTGTGVMLGLPWQTMEQIAGDILFFRDMNIDMIGMGPYIPHDQTPLAEYAEHFSPEEQLALGLKTIAVTRLLLKNVNIASTTALKALHPEGRLKGLLAGANVIMPNLTEQEYRPGYQLYRNKPGIREDSLTGLQQLEAEVTAAGEQIAWDDWGDSPHFFAEKRHHV